MASFIENLRQWTSEQADKLTGQENTYHRSSGKTQKEYEQDLDFYKNLEDVVRKSAVILGAIDGAVASGGAAAAAGAPLLTAIPEVAANAWMGHLYPWMGAAVQKGLDNARNGGSPKARRYLEEEEEEEEEDIKKERVIHPLFCRLRKTCTQSYLGRLFCSI